MNEQQTAAIALSAAGQRELEAFARNLEGSPLTETQQDAAVAAYRHDLVRREAGEFPPAPRRCDVDLPSGRRCTGHAGENSDRCEKHDPRKLTLLGATYADWANYFRA